jgi:putative transport protein
MKIYQLNLGHALGLFAGSGTSTATLQAALAALGSDDAAVGHSVAYPFGVAGPILLMYITFALVKPKIAAIRLSLPARASWRRPMSRTSAMR